jgi:hypothetical protein
MLNIGVLLGEKVGKNEILDLSQSELFVNIDISNRNFLVPT